MYCEWLLDEVVDGICSMELICVELCGEVWLICLYYFGIKCILLVLVVFWWCYLVVCLYVVMLDVNVDIV